MRFVDNYLKWSPTLVVGYALTLRALSEFLLTKGIGLTSPKAVISSAELLDVNTQQLIQKAFRCPVIDRYGSRETGLIACQCLEQQGYHVNMMRIYLEIVDEKGQDISQHDSGEILVTDLANYGMPLIRYQIGDRARWSQKNYCSCGRNFELLSTIEGRTFDYLITSDGKKIHGLYFNKYLFTVPEISHYRLVQESHDFIRLQIVENKPLADTKIEQIRTVIRDKIGENVIVQIERVSHIKKGASGKLCYIENHLTTR
jgi:phenylacetate-CoA ligase